MMANFLGLSTFNKGIANYLHANSLSNANQDDLWSFLTAAGQVLPAPKVILYHHQSSYLDLAVSLVTSCFSHLYQLQREGQQCCLVISSPTLHATVVAGRWNIGRENGEGSDGHLDSPDGLSSHQHRQVQVPLGPPLATFLLKLKLKCRHYDGSKSATARQER